MAHDPTMFPGPSPTNPIQISFVPSGRSCACWITGLPPRERSVSRLDVGDIVVVTGAAGRLIPLPSVQPA